MHVMLLEKFLYILSIFQFYIVFCFLSFKLFILYDESQIISIVVYLDLPAIVNYLLEVYVY